MAQKVGKQTEWPRVKRDPGACYQTPDGLFESNRDVAGELRFGTAPGCGPRGNSVIPAGRTSDFGMDRLEQRPVDRIGQKYPEVDPAVKLISETARRRNRY